MYIQPAKLNRQQQRQEFILPRGAIYLGSDDTGHYIALDGLFDDVGNMFKRMVKITPKSFRPANIFKAVTSGALTVATGGAYQLLPSKMKTQIENVGKIAVPVIGGAVLAYTAGPAVWNILQPKLAAVGAMLGKNASQVGGLLSNVLGGLSQSGQAKVVEAATTEQIAQMEQTGQIPPALQSLINQAAMESLVPPAPIYSSPMAQGYATDGVPPQPPVEAGMFSGDNALLMIGGLTVAALLFGSKK